jgi:hypothetical protein
VGNCCNAEHAVSAKTSCKPFLNNKVDTLGVIILYPQTLTRIGTPLPQRRLEPLQQNHTISSEETAFYTTTAQITLTSPYLTYSPK